MSKKRVFSGIQPSGDLHLGNYVGAIKQWVELQKNYECIYCIVDLHAITVPQDPEVLKKRSRGLVALYLACGVDPEKSAVFIQSHNPDHASLSWALGCIATMGQMERMTQYKSKSGRAKDQATVGLFSYPALMAADILLYQTDLVPVGEDQKQHVELTRDLAQRFNSRYEHVFQIPEAKVMKTGARIMSLQLPDTKMSKSSENKNGTIDLLDPLSDVRRKIRSAVTDSGKEVAFGPEKPGISNLLTIYSLLTDRSVESLESDYQDKGYGDFKRDLAEVTVDFLRPIQDRYKKVKREKGYLDKILADGLKKVRPKSQKTLQKVYRAMGLG